MLRDIASEVYTTMQDTVQGGTGYPGGDAEPGETGVPSRLCG